MREPLIRALGLATSLLAAGALAWTLTTQPRSLADIGGGVAASVGLYRIDQAAFAEGLRFFRADQFAEARAAFDRADPAARDAITQFYKAYAFYRQGWGRLYNDDGLFRQAVETLDRADAVAPGGTVHVDDPGLGLRTSDELRAELQRGLTREAGDFNPLRVFRSRQ
jgi:tetratricopeptide (TPR) repeat protein